MSPTDIEKFRIETLSHPDTHLYSATIYYPIHSLNPIAQTACIYKTKQEAHTAVQELIKVAFSQTTMRTNETESLSSAEVAS